MNVATIVKAGDPILATVSKPITNFGTKELKQFIEYLFFTMDHYNGAGLAAPQIGENRRILVYGIENNPRYPNVAPIKKTVLINPEILAFSEDKKDFYEGCLSLPNIRGLVSRSHSIKYKAYNWEGKCIENTAYGFEARAIQHELDHLNGLLYPMRMSDNSTFKYSAL